MQKKDLPSKHFPHSSKYWLVVHSQPMVRCFVLYLYSYRTAATYKLHLNHTSPLRKDPILICSELHDVKIQSYMP